MRCVASEPSGRGRRVMNMKIGPTLFVGFGGTGYAVLSNIKTSLARTLPHGGKVPGIFQFLVMDIDEISIGSDELPPGNYTFKPKTREFLAAKLPPPNQLEERIQKKKDGYKYIAPWWPKGLGSKAWRIYGEKNLDQAFQVRKFGRAAMFAYAQRYRAGIDRAIAHVTDAARVAELSASNEIELDGGLNVYVVSSLAGGTGSGMCLDGLAILKDVLSKSNVPNTTISTFFLMPDVFKGALGGELTASRVNAYGALKEFDAILCGKKKVVERYTDSYSVDVDELTTFLYLIDVQNERGQTFGGRQTIGRMISEFIFHLSTGLGHAVDFGEGRLADFAGLHKLEEGGKSVSHAYSSFGYQEVIFPFDEIISYAKTFFVQCVLGDLQKGYDKLAEGDILDMAKNVLEGDYGAPQEYERHKWFTQLVPDLGTWDIPFLNRDSGEYKEVSRKTLKQTIKQSYDNADRSVKKLSAGCKHRCSFGDKKLREAAEQWIDKHIGRYLRDPHTGLAATSLFLDELEDRLKAAKNKYLAESKEAEGNRLKKKDKQEIENDLQLSQKKMLWSTREQLLRPCLTKYQTDIKQYRRAEMASLVATALDYLLDNVLPDKKDVLSALSRSLGERIQDRRDDLRKVTADIDRRRQNERFSAYVGCEEVDLDALKEKIRDVARNKESEARSMMAEDLGIDVIDWDRLSEEAIERLGLEEQTVLDHLGTGETMVKYLNKVAERAAPLWTYSESDTESAKFFLLSAFSDEEWAKRLDGNAGNLTPDLKATPALDKGRICFVGLRDAVPAEYIKSVRQCYDEYKDSKGRATKLKVSVEVIPGSALWDDLFAVGGSTDSYIAAAEELDILERKGGGYCDLHLSELRSFRYKQLPAKLAEDASLFDELNRAIRSAMLEMGPQACKKWLFDHEGVIPEAIEIGVRGSLGI